MAEDLVLGLKAELDEGSLSEIQGKIDKIKNGKENKITFKIDNEVNTQITNLQKSLDAISKKPYRIDIQIDRALLGNIQNLAGEIGQALSGSIEQQVGNINNAFQAIERTALQGLASRTLTFVDGEQVKQTEKFNESLGRTTTIIDDLNSGSRTEVLSFNFEKQNKELERSLDKLTQYQNKIETFRQEAFSRDQKLSGTAYEEDVRNELDRIGSVVSAKMEEVKAKITIVDPDFVRQMSTDLTNVKNLIDNSFDLAFPRTRNGQSDLESQIQTQLNLLEAYKTQLGDLSKYPESIQSSFGKLKEMLSLAGDKESQVSINDYISALRVLQSEVKKVDATFKADSAIENFETKLKKSENALDGFAIRYKEAFKAHPELVIEMDSLREKLASVDNATGLQNVNNQISEFSQRVRNAQSELDPFIGRAKSLSQVLQQNFGGVGQYLARFTSSFYIISKGIQTVKSMVNEVKALDTSLMELQKVTDLTGSSLTNFTENAYNIGKEVGRTGKDVIDAVTTFSRAGYDLNEATQLAQSALVMTNVGVDIPNTAAAASDMISILKAFDKQADESMSVIDKLYNVANKEPLDFGNLTQMLVTAGGTLAQTGTTLEQTMGLLTGAYSTLRDTSVSNG